MVKKLIKNWHYECPDCTQTFERPEAFQRHTKKAHNKSTTACRNCPMFFDELSELFLHARQIHNNRTMENKQHCKHACTFAGCTYRTDNGGLMKHHVRSHTNNKPYMCDICKKTFTQKSNMKTHFNRHNKDQETFRCDVCDKVFYSHDTFLSHKETREHEIAAAIYDIIVIFQCALCEARFDNPEDAYFHGDLCRVNFGAELFDCLSCSARLICNLEDLNQHYQMHKKIKCPHCSHEFTDRTKFNFHLTKVHRNKVERKKTCRYCEQVFVNEEERNKHIEDQHKDLKNKHRSWEENGRFPCPTGNCPFKTNSRMCLQKHLLTHNKDLNIDSLYKVQTNELSAGIKRESIVNETPRKRGRPLLSDNIDNIRISSSTSPPEFHEPKKQRGRPRKSDMLKTDSPMGIRKRGRPPKVKSEAIDHMMTDQYYQADYDENNPEFYSIDNINCDDDLFFMHSQFNTSFKDEYVEIYDV